MHLESFSGNFICSKLKHKNIEFSLCTLSKVWLPQLRVSLLDWMLGFSVLGQTASSI